VVTPVCILMAGTTPIAKKFKAFIIPAHGAEVYIGALDNVNIRVGNVNVWPGPHIRLFGTA